MNIEVGIILAFVAMLSWGFGDFLMQRSIRRLGNWRTLFFISTTGAVMLLPFVWNNIPKIFSPDSRSILTVLLLSSLILFVAAVLDFEALKRGKLAIVEPIWSVEVPVAGILAFIILREEISLLQIILIATLLVSLIVLSVKENIQIKRFILEKGAIYAFLGALFMGVANFMVGWGGRLSDPLMVNFFVDVLIAILSGLYLLVSKQLQSSFGSFRDNFNILLSASILDKIAWIAFVFAMVFAPIAIATALSESYIIVAVILGLSLNKERLNKYQKWGMILAIISAVILVSVTSL